MRKIPLNKLPDGLKGFILGVGIISLVNVYKQDFPLATLPADEGEKVAIDIRFSPKGGGLALALGAINHAQDHIYAHAYSFTSKPISEALIAAHRRGVTVKLLIDKRESKSRYCRAEALMQAGIEVQIDPVAGLAHNKVLIIDNTRIVTGSFNWSASAENRNAENILLITSEKVNTIYTHNWHTRYQRARRKNQAA